MENPSTPPPFGDPTKIRKENSSAVTKGVLIGCGGCAVLVAIMVIMAGLIFYGIMASLRQSDACQKALELARNSEVMKQELGEPIEMGWFVSGSVSIKNGLGDSDFSVPISGPKGGATVYIVGKKQGGGPWDFSKVDAVLDNGGRVVDLRPAAAISP